MTFSSYPWQKFQSPRIRKSYKTRLLHSISTSSRAVSTWRQHQACINRYAAQKPRIVNILARTKLDRWKMRCTESCGRTLPPSNSHISSPALVRIRAAESSSFFSALTYNVSAVYILALCLRPSLLVTRRHVFFMSYLALSLPRLSTRQPGKCNNILESSLAADTFIVLIYIYLLIFIA